MEQMVTGFGCGGQGGALVVALSVWTQRQRDETAVVERRISVRFATVAGCGGRGDRRNFHVAIRLVGSRHDGGRVAIIDGNSVRRVNGDDGDFRAPRRQSVQLDFGGLRLAVRPVDAQQFGQVVDKDALDPGRHSVGGRRTEVDVEHCDGHHDGQRHQDHGEE